MHHWHLDRSLTSADRGRELAEHVIQCLDCYKSIELDFSAVEVFTPSFANAFVMTMLHSVPLDTLRERCIMANRPEWVSAMINQAARRYMSGIRLSSQAATQTA